MPSIPNLMSLKTMRTILWTPAHVLLRTEKAVTSWELSVKNDIKIQEKNTVPSVIEQQRGSCSLPGSTALVRATEMLPQPPCEPLDVLTSFFASSGLAYTLCTQWADSSQLLTSLTIVDGRGVHNK